MDKEEEHAISEIDKAIDEIKRAAIDDGKNLKRSSSGRYQGWIATGRFHRAQELLDKAHNDIAREEDGPVRVARSSQSPAPFITSTKLITLSIN